MKGIILAGGSGTRLYPITETVCKQLLPIYDKPMVYYPLSALMLAGIRDILIISTPSDTKKFDALFGDGSLWGLHIEYMIQEKPEGIAQALTLGQEFIGDDQVCLILGDNIFYGQGLSDLFKESKTAATNGFATVFGYSVNDPERYGVVDFDKNGKALSIEEKPDFPKSKYAVTGIYFYPSGVSKYVSHMKPSKRGELEITDVNKYYLRKGLLKVETLGRGYAWLDTGTFDSLLEAGEFIAMVERRQGLKIACIEEIAYGNGWMTKEQVLEIAKDLSKNNYGQYLKKLVE